MTHRVLVVEDVRSIRVLVRMILEMRGFEVEEAEHGGYAMTALDAGLPFDLLITDLAMPDVDGKTLVAWVRERSAVPILVITGYADHCDELLELGASACLSKPFTANQLVQRVLALLREPPPPEAGGNAHR